MNKDEGNTSQIREIVHYIVHKNITRLFKSFLDINGEIKNEHEIMLNKIAEKYSTEFAKDIDYFTASKSEFYRKKILDSGNECIRDIVGFLEAFDIQINEKKLENFLDSKKIIRRRVFSGVTASKIIKE